jgi:hypothetical protein
MIRRLRALLLIAVSVGLVSVAAYLLPGTPLAAPAAIAGLGSFLLALG